VAVYFLIFKAYIYLNNKAMKIEKFSVFRITEDRDLIEKLLGDDDVPNPGSRFLVIESDSETTEAILENYDGEFDLEDESAYFTTKHFKKLAEFEGMIARGRVNTF
jgi:hypothetical protein